MSCHCYRWSDAGMTYRDFFVLGPFNLCLQLYYFLVLDLDPKVYVSILASSFTPEQSVIKEITASFPMSL